MQDGMQLASLFSNLASVQTTPGAPFAKAQPAGDKGSFFNVLNSSISNNNNLSNSNPANTNSQNGVTQAGYAADDDFAGCRQFTQSTKPAQPQQSQPAENTTNMTEAEASEMAKELDGLSKEAEEMIEYICSILGVSVENVQEIMLSLLQDTKLLFRENADFLDSAEAKGADNILLMKMESLVSLLNEMADFVAETSSIDPEAEIADIIVDTKITNTQSELKGFTVKTEGSDIPYDDFAKVIQVIKDTSVKEAILAQALSAGEELSPAELDEISALLKAHTGNSQPTDTTETISVSDGNNPSEKPVADDVNALTATAAANITGTSDANAEPKGIPNEILKAEVSVKDLAGVSGSNHDSEEEPALPGKSGDTVALPKDEQAAVAKADFIKNLEFEVISQEPRTSDADTSIDDETDTKAVALKAGEGGKAYAAKSDATFKFMDIKGNAVLDRAAKIDVITQIMDKAGATLKSGQSVISIKLKPEHLGEVFMKITVESGRVVAKMVTESYFAKDAIETNLYQLKEALNTQGIKIDKFNVFVGDKWQEHNGHPNQHYQPGSNAQKGYLNQGEFDAYGADAVSGAVIPGGAELFCSSQINFFA